jgi:hypothetical protein
MGAGEFELDADELPCRVGVVGRHSRYDRHRKCGSVTVAERSRDISRGDFARDTSSAERAFAD